MRSYPPCSFVTWLFEDWCRRLEIDPQWWEQVLAGKARAPAHLRQFVETLSRGRVKAADLGLQDGAEAQGLLEPSAMTPAAESSPAPSEPPKGKGRNRGKPDHDFYLALDRVPVSLARYARQCRPPIAAQLFQFWVNGDRPIPRPVARRLSELMGVPETAWRRIREDDPNGTAARLVRPRPE